MELSSVDDFRRIGLGHYVVFDYSGKNESSQRAYVSDRVDMEMSGLYELVGTGS